MSARLILLAVSCLALTACDGNPFDTAARKVACACPTPATATPPAAAPARTAQAAAPRQRASGGAPTYRVRTEPVVVRETRAYGYQASDEGLSGGYGGRYGSRGDGYAAGGVRVSVQESESSSERYSYRESSSGYAYGSASGGGLAVTGAPQQPYVRYKSASTTPGGWLEWPGKVED